MSNPATSTLVSVVIPAYNAAAFLSETIQSVLDQTHTNLELVVVDDGSKDQTAEIAQSFTSDSRVRYLHQANAGVSVARNNGFAKTTGEFVAFLDADDVLLPTNLEKKLAYFTTNPAFGLVHADMEVVNEKTERTGTIMAGQEGQLLEKLLLWEGTCVPTPSSILVRRSVVEKVGGFDPELSNNADQEFFFRVAHAGPIGRVAEVLALYRDHANQMHKNIARMERDTLLAYQRAEESQLFPSTSMRKKAFAKMYLILAGSWWKDGNNKIKGLQYIARAVWTRPAVTGQLLNKLTGKA